MRTLKSFQTLLPVAYGKEVRQPCSLLPAPYSLPSPITYAI